MVPPDNVPPVDEGEDPIPPEPGSGEVVVDGPPTSQSLKVERRSSPIAAIEGGVALEQ
jgi:hypothetical protein